jgi:hypothetical protein
VLKRSIDARQKNNKINLKVAVYFKGEPFQDEKNSNSSDILMLAMHKEVV